MLTQNHADADFRMTALAIEYRTQPLGLDEPHPRFSWKLSENATDIVQTAYRIVVSAKAGIVWDTGHVSSDGSIQIPYEGPRLKPRTEYAVRVEASDQYGHVAARAAVFETGLGSGNAFRGDFIACPSLEGVACPVLCQSIEIDMPVVRARLYATALGLYRFDVNHRKVGDLYLTPYWTNYKKRLEYQTYDVTGMLTQGINHLEMTIAGGWYQGVFGVSCSPCNYGKTIAGLAELHIEFADGTTRIVATDSTWIAHPSLIRSAELYDGETQDITLDRSALHPVRVVAFDKGRIVAQENEPVRVIERIKPVALIRTPKGAQVLDFGQNHSGVVQFGVQGRAGQKVTLRHAEIIGPDGEIYTANLRRAKATDRYVLSDGWQVLSPEFTFHGYRYVAVEGVDIIPADYVSLALSSDLEKTGRFVTGNPDIDRLQSNIAWSQLSNFVDVPTDCPQRDERLGWTADCQVFAPTAAFNRNVALFYAKWLRDLASEQMENGIVPHIIPNLLPPADGAAVWSDAAVIVPWVVYQEYGDRDVLRRQWPSMTRWVDHVTSKTIDGLWVTGFQYGDWLALDVLHAGDAQGGTDRYLVANAYYLHSIDILVKTAEVLGDEAAKTKYGRLYDRTLAAFRAEYISPNGRLVCETQTAYTLALRFRLLAGEQARKAARKLASLLQKNDNHLLTGFAGTPHLCPVLSDHGFHATANHLLMNDDYPSWLYEIRRGATTLWERWNGIKPDGTLFDPAMNSFNHYAYGSIGEWLYRHVAGIAPAEPGYRKIAIRPNLTRGLPQVRAEFDSPYGTIVSAYAVEAGKGVLHVEIPVNTTAAIRVPGSDITIHTGSGAYDYPFATDLDFHYSSVNLDLTLSDLIAMDGGAMAINGVMPSLSSAAVAEATRNETLRSVAERIPDGTNVIERIFAEIRRQARQG